MKENNTNQAPNERANWVRFAVFLLLIFAAKSSLANWNYVPSGSMQPNLLIGDLIWVNHTAYDLRVPFSQKRLAWFEQPKRGDIVVARSPDDNVRIVKRLVAIPGDRIEVFGDLIRVNGKAEYSSSPSLSIPGESAHHRVGNEIVLGHQRTILLRQGHRAMQTQLIELGSDEYFVMGDHRDNSLDSRSYGPLAREQILGRATHIVGSLDYGHSWRPRFERFFTRLD